MMHVLSAPIPAPAQLPETALCIWMWLPGDVCGALDCIRGRFRMQTVVRQCAWCVNILSQWEAGFLVRPTLAKGPKFLFLFLENSVTVFGTIKESFSSQKQETPDLRNTVY